MTERGPAGHTAAIIVSYNAPEKLERTLSALRHQVTEVIVVDNGSALHFRKMLRALATRHDATLVELGENLGIGAALNRGVEKACDFNVAWILTMDQDSTLAPDFISAMTVAWKECGRPDCLTPGFDRQRSGIQQCRPVRYAITSGNLITADLYHQVGGFDEGLFIDGVDFDFSLRVRRAGFPIVMVPSARMSHELGERQSKVSFHTVHGPQRRYYMYRNIVLLLRRHARHHPAFMFRLLIAQVLSAATAILFGPTRRAACAAIALGIWDGFRGRDGRGRILRW